MRATVILLSGFLLLGSKCFKDPAFCVWQPSLTTEQLSQEYPLTGSSPNIDVFVINLDRSTDRLESISKQLKAQSIDFTRISAVLGAAENKAKLAEEGILAESNINMPGGELGNFLSHRKSWKQIVSNSESFSFGPKPIASIVLEDDVDIPTDFLQRVASVVERLPNEWDMLYLGCYGCEIWGGAMMSLKDEIHNKAIKLKPHGFAGNYASLITPIGAKKLLECTKPIYEPTDWQLRDELIGEGCKIDSRQVSFNAYCAIPELVVPNQFESIIDREGGRT